MRRKGFRAWHGLIAGAMVGFGVWQMSDTLTDVGGKPAIANGISIRQFISAVTQPPGDDSVRRIEDVVVHPAHDAKNLVTLRATGGGRPDVRGEFFAPIPFVVPAPQPAPRSRFSFGEPPPPPKPQTYADVRAYLAKAAPAMSYRYAWWELPAVRAGVWVVPPIALLGGLLPLSLVVLRRLGVLPPPPEPEPEPAPLPPAMAEHAKADDVDAAIDMAAVNAQLAAATEAIERQLATQSADPASAPVPIAEPEAEPVAATAHGSAPPESPVPAAVPGDPTTYDGGVYYPVHRPRPGER